jgi:hypothetical protein
MNLLYCLNGIVVAWHDDADPAVAATTYGTGVRIIPYDQPMNTLSTQGPAAVPQYLQPAETKTILLAYAAQCRYNASVEVVNFTPAGGGSIPVSTGRSDQSLLNNLATHAQSLAGTAAINFTQNNIAYLITATDVINMFHAVMAHIQTARNAEASCIADLNSTTPTIKSYADVDAKFAGI